MNQFDLTNMLWQSQLVDQIGFVLANCLWQFLMVSVGYAVVVKPTSNPRIRYVIGLFGMSLCLIAPLATFWFVSHYSQPMVSDSGVANQVNLTLPNPILDLDSTPNDSKEGFVGEATDRKLQNYVGSDSVGADSDGDAKMLASSHSPSFTDATFAGKFQIVIEQIRHRLSPYSPALFLIWVVGIVAFSIRPLLGLNYVRQLRRSKKNAAAQSIMDTVDQLRESLGIRRTIEVFQSAMVQVPVVVGYLRPIILLPVSALTNLTSTELETILRHELAHIRRHDALVNFLQTILETLFFFHPAVWWLSNQIRVERENCCDDLAVQDHDQAIVLAKALFRLEQNRVVHSPAMAANGGNLKMRIERLVNREKGTQKQMLTTTRFSSAASLMAILLAVVVSLSAITIANPTTNSATDDQGKMTPKSVEVQSVGDSHAWKTLKVTDAKSVREFWALFPGIELGKKGAAPEGYEIDMQVIFNTDDKKFVIGVNSKKGLWNQGNGDFLVSDRKTLMKKIDAYAKMSGYTKNQKTSPQARPKKGSVVIEFNEELDTMIIKGDREMTERVRKMMTNVAKGKAAENVILDSSKKPSSKVNDLSAAEMELARAKNQLDKKMIEFRQHILNYEQALVKLDHSKKLYEKGFINKTELSEATLIVDAKRAEMQSAEIDYAYSAKSFEAYKKALGMNSKLTVDPATSASAKGNKKPKPEPKATSQPRAKSKVNSKSKTGSATSKASSSSTKSANQTAQTSNPNSALSRESENRKIALQSKADILKVQLNYSKSELQLAEESFDRTEKLYQNKTISRSELNRAKLDVRKAAADLQILEIQLKEAYDELRNISKPNMEKPTVRSEPVRIQNPVTKTSMEIIVVELEFAQGESQLIEERYKALESQVKSGVAKSTDLLELKQDLLLSRKKLRILELRLQDARERYNQQRKDAERERAAKRTLEVQQKNSVLRDIKSQDPNAGDPRASK